MAGASETLQRRLRDPRPEVWRPACVALGRGASGDASWHKVMHDLLASRLPEMRVRGLVALGASAPGASHAAARAMADALQDKANVRDPVWLDAFFEILPQVGDHGVALALVQDALCDVRDTVRAAAVRSLKAWPRLLEEHMLELADDTSVVVQTSLVSLLADVPTTDGVVAAYERMAASSDSMLREFVAHELPRGVQALEPILARLAADEEAGVSEAARDRGGASSTVWREAGPRPPCHPPTGPGTSSSDWRILQAIEARLDENPTRALDVLRPTLELEDGVLLLERLTSLARRESVSTLCEALALLCDRLHNRSREAVGEALCHADQLLARSSVARGGDLHRIVGACSRAYALPTTAHIVDWCRCPDVGLPEQLDPLRRACDGTQGTSFREALDEARDTLERTLPVPERWAVLAVLDQWNELIEDEREDESEEFSL